MKIENGDRGHGTFLTPPIRQRALSSSFFLELELTARSLKDREIRFHERPMHYARRPYAQENLLARRPLGAVVHRPLLI